MKNGNQEQENKNKKGKYKMNFKEFLKSKEQYKPLNEAKMLDISIKPAHKVLINEKNIKEFLNSNVIVEEKTDGIKITLIKIANTGSLDDWIISYKGEILYDNEFNYLSDDEIKTHSIANAQFKFVIDHFKKIGKTKIPVNTELFIEYIMRKPTLSSSYTRNHGMVLVGYSKSTYKVKHGKLFTKPNGFETIKRLEIANSLDLDVPAVLFNGKVDTKSNFEKGILNKELGDIFKSKELDWELPELLVQQIGDILIKVDSYYGGTMEGVVCKYSNKLIKFQKVGQVDQEARDLIKSKWKEGTVEDENEYWDKVRSSALSVIENIDRGLSMKKVSQEISKNLKDFQITFTHSKKNKQQIRDDIQGNCKMIIIKQIDGNNGALFFGKYRILTKAHSQIIENMIKTYDSTNIVLVSSKDTKFSKEIRRKQLETVFGKRINIQESISGNIITLMNKFDDNINVVLCGSDRADAYRQILIRNPDMSVVEIPRNDADISATKIIENIEDKEYFKENTHKKLWPMYDELKELYTN